MSETDNLLSSIINDFFEKSKVNYYSSTDYIIKTLPHKTSIENELKQFESRFLSFLKYDDIPIDYTCHIEKELVTLFKRDKETCVNWLSDKIIKYYDNSRILLNLLKLIGNIDGTVGAISYFIFGTTLSHTNVEIKEFALRIQEKWQSKEYHQILKNSHMSPKWLDEYRQEIVKDFEEIEHELSC